MIIFTYSKIDDDKVMMEHHLFVIVHQVILEHHVILDY